MNWVICITSDSLILYITIHNTITPNLSTPLYWISQDIAHDKKQQLTTSTGLGQINKYNIAFNIAAIVRFSFKPISWVLL